MSDNPEWLPDTDPRPPYIDVGARRCALRASEWLPDWWVTTSPRNGDDALAEGSWAEWVALADRIIELNGTLKAAALSDSNGRRTEP